MPAKRPFVQTTSSHNGCARAILAQMENPEHPDIKRVLVLTRARYKAVFGGDPAEMDEQTIHQALYYLRQKHGRPLTPDKLKEYLPSATPTAEVKVNGYARLTPTGRQIVVSGYDRSKPTLSPTTETKASPPQAEAKQAVATVAKALAGSQTSKPANYPTLLATAEKFVNLCGGDVNLASGLLDDLEEFLEARK